MSEPEPKQAEGVEPEQVTKEGLLKLIDSELQSIASTESRMGATTWVLLSAGAFVAWKIVELAPELGSMAAVGVATTLTMSWAFTLSRVFEILQPRGSARGSGKTLVEPRLRTLALFRLAYCVAELAVIWAWVPAGLATKAVLSLPPAAAVIVMVVGIVATYRPVRFRVPVRPLVVAVLLGFLATTWGSIVLVHRLEARALQFALLVWALREIVIRLLNKKLDAADEAGLRHTRKELTLGIIPIEIARIRVELALLGSTTRRLLGEELDAFEESATAFLEAQAELARHLSSSPSFPWDAAWLDAVSAHADAVLSKSKVNMSALDDLRRKIRMIAGRSLPQDSKGVRDISRHTEAWVQRIIRGLEEMNVAIKKYPIPKLPEDVLDHEHVTSPGSPPASTEPDPTDPPSESESPPQPE